MKLQKIGLDGRRQRRVGAMKNLRFVSTAFLAAGLMLCQRTASAQVVTTFAGSGKSGNVDGNVADATFSGPQGLAVDPAGNFYIADTGNLKIRKITPDGLVATFAGDGHPGYDDGLATKAGFFGPLGVAVDASGNVWVADQDDGFDGQFLKMITTSGQVQNLLLYPGSNPSGIAFDNSGNIYVSDLYFGFWKMRADGRASLRSPTNARGVAVDGAGNAYLADRDHNRIEKIAADGAVTTLAGSGSPGSADGIGTEASFRDPTGLAVDALGNVYVADRGNHKIRMITPAGTVTTLAGSGSPGGADGTGTSASFNFPTGLAVDSRGDLYVADSGNNRIRKIALQGGSHATFSRVLDLSVSPDGTTSFLRFDEGTMQTSLDTLDKTGSVTSGSPLGPYEGWTPRAAATGLDALTRVLWNNEDGSAALWLTDLRVNQASFLFGPVSGATAVDVAATAAGTTHLLWTHQDGSVALWSVDGSGQVLTKAAYGPYEGWTASAISDGADGLTRLLWKNADGRTGLSIHSSQGMLAIYRYGPFDRWNAFDLGVGGDNQTRILWSHTDGRVAIGIVGAAGEFKPGPVYSSPAGLTARHIAAGPDGSSRILFTDDKGGAVVWLMSPAGVFEDSIDLTSRPTAHSPHL